MAQVDIIIGGRNYQLACRDGDENRLRFLADIVDKEVVKVSEQLHVAGDIRRLMLASLLLADQNEDIKSEASAAESQNQQLQQQKDQLTESLKLCQEKLKMEQEEKERLAVLIEDYAERMENIVNRLDDEAQAS
ncbi:cell division protein ZapA [Zymomonas mobilis]|uniref:cell division protein ZapA n=1 Tax=Zymomonas mobilis TaxID=542 RepID=UPI000B38971C|nr:cell division protein ZapA [Zymomonas mobilis]ART93501.1 cell division protein ZapA [Zymomonas mobilis subsp. mobilis]TWD60209.1 cell division protein ZapA [Zymomonas mobilis]